MASPFLSYQPQPRFEPFQIVGRTKNSNQGRCQQQAQGHTQAKSSRQTRPSPLLKRRRSPCPSSPRRLHLLLSQKPSSLSQACSCLNRHPRSQGKAQSDRRDKKIEIPAAISSVMVNKEISFGALASKHRTSTKQLNELNGWSLKPTTILAKGSEIYVPGI